MSDRLSKNKVYIVGIFVVILIILGFIIGSAVQQNSGGNDKTDAKQEEPYDGDGLEVEDEMDESVENIDGSGSWEEESKDSQKKEEKNTESKKEQEDNPTNNTNKENNNSDDNETNDNESPELQDDILEDDKAWGEIS